MILSGATKQAFNFDFLHQKYSGICLKIWYFPSRLFDMTYYTECCCITFKLANLIGIQWCSRCTKIIETSKRNVVCQMTVRSFSCFPSFNIYHHRYDCGIKNLSSSLRNAVLYSFRNNLLLSTTNIFKRTNLYFW